MKHLKKDRLEKIRKKAKIKRDIIKAQKNMYELGNEKLEYDNNILIKKD